MDLSLSKLREMVKDGEARRAAVHGVAKSQTGLSDWTAKSTAGSCTRIEGNTLLPATGPVSVQNHSVSSHSFREQTILEHQAVCWWPTVHGVAKNRTRLSN